jgi:hypothetical protein
MLTTYTYKWFQYKKFPTVAFGKKMKLFSRNFFSQSSSCRPPPPPFPRQHRPNSKFFPNPKLACLVQVHCDMLRNAAYLLAVYKRVQIYERLVINEKSVETKLTMQVQKNIIIDLICRLRPLLELPKIFRTFRSSFRPTARYHLERRLELFK